MDHRPLKRPQFFFTTAPLPCPYLPNKVERKIVTELSGPSAEKVHESLASGGFRRSHSIAYAPACPNCQACVPIRVIVQKFVRRRTLSRVWNQNSDLDVILGPAAATVEHFELFSHYQQRRHPGSDMAMMGVHEYSAMVEDSPIETFIIEYREKSGKLVAVCLTDKTTDGLSAVYSFFDTDCGRHGIGNYVILWLLDYAKTLGLPYTYLGYWIASSPKMSYKTRFQPLEGLRAEGWTPLRRLDG